MPFERSIPDSPGHPGQMTGCQEAEASQQGLHDRRWVLAREHFLAASGEHCPLADMSIDAVMMRSVLIYIPDRRAAATEIGRILRPRGRMVAYEPINRKMAHFVDMTDFSDIERAYRLAWCETG